MERGFEFVHVIHFFSPTGICEIEDFPRFQVTANTVFFFSSKAYFFVSWLHLVLSVSGVQIEKYQRALNYNGILSFVVKNMGETETWHKKTRWETMRTAKTNGKQGPNSPNSSEGSPTPSTGSASKTKPGTPAGTPARWPRWLQTSQPQSCEWCMCRQKCRKFGHKAYETKTSPFCGSWVPPGVGLDTLWQGGGSRLPLGQWGGGLLPSSFNPYNLLLSNPASP